MAKTITVGTRPVRVDIPPEGASVANSGATVFHSVRDGLTTANNDGQILSGSTANFDTSQWFVSASSTTLTVDVVTAVAVTAPNFPFQGDGNGSSLAIGSTLPSLIAGSYSNVGYGGGWRGSLPQLGNLGSVTTGFDNTAIGAGVSISLTTGHSTVAVGADALSSSTTGINNVAIGPQAAETITTASRQIAVGAAALQLATTPSAANIAIGTNALSDLTTGVRNTAVGDSAFGSQLTTANDTTAVGHNAGLNVSNGPNTVVGSFALQGNASPTNVTNNVAVGYSALKLTTTANSNTAVGTSSMNVTTTGGGNVAVGANAGTALIIGTNNVVVGFGAGVTATSTDGSSMVLIGKDAVGGGNQDTAIGKGASATGGASTALGCSTAASGAGSVALGQDSGGAGTATAVNNQIALGTANQHILLKTAAAPADATLAASQFTLWLDATNGAAKLMCKAKQANGTVVTAAVALA